MGSGHESAVNRVIDHVRRHLDQPLPLEHLARVANFSPFHFHRVFGSETGETVAQFTRRARLERAVRLMRAAPHRSLSSIGAEVGFSTPSEFSRVFRQVYGRSPSSWDRLTPLGAAHRWEPASDRDGGLGQPTLVDRPSARVAYLRVADPWTGDHLAVGYRSLLDRVEGLGIDWRRRSLVGLSWESPQATAPDQLTYDLGFSLVDGVDATDVTDAGLGLIELPAVRAVEVHCHSLPDTGLAWELLYRHWFPASGHEPADLPAIKRFRSPPDVLDRTAWEVDCSVALRPGLGPVEGLPVEVRKNSTAPDADRSSSW